MDSQAWDAFVERKLAEQAVALTEALAGGTAKDYAEYQLLCGKIRGIQFAMDVLIQARQKFETEDAADWTVVRTEDDGWQAVGEK